MLISAYMGITRKQRFAAQSIEETTHESTEWEALKLNANIVALQNYSL